MHEHRIPSASFFESLQASVPRRLALLDLPEDVLLLILRHVRHPPSLMAVRLACRQLRKASLHLITTFHISDDASSLRSTRHRPSTQHLLEALPGLTRVDLSGRLRNLKSYLALPTCASLLRQLSICPRSCSAKAGGELCSRVKRATGLTAIVWGPGEGDYWDISPEIAGGEWLFPNLLARCPQLAALEVRWGGSLPADSTNAVLRLTRLHTLRITSRRTRLWERLLPRLAALPNLAELACAPLDGQAAVAQLAALTRLTRLEVYLPRAITLKPLTRLSRLEALWVRRNMFPMHPNNPDEVAGTTFNALPSGLTRLTERSSADIHAPASGSLSPPCPPSAALSSKRDIIP